MGINLQDKPISPNGPYFSESLLTGFIKGASILLLNFPGCDDRETVCPFQVHGCREVHRLAESRRPGADEKRFGPGLLLSAQRLRSRSEKCLRAQGEKTMYSPP